jgi:hypothetical protein
LGGDNADRRAISETPSFSLSRFVILFMEFCERILEHGHGKYDPTSKNLRADFPPDANNLGGFPKT